MPLHILAQKDIQLEKLEALLKEEEGTKNLWQVSKTYHNIMS